MNFFKKIPKTHFLTKIFTSFMIYSGTNFVTRAIPFFLLPILTRLLTPGDYGILATFTAMMGIVNVIIPAGNQAVVRGYVDRDKKDFNYPQYVCSSIFISLACFLLLLAIILLLKSLISRALSMPENWLFLLPVIGICFALYKLPAKLYIFKKKALPFSALQISSSFAEIIFSVFLVAVIGLDWRGRVLGITINSMLFSAVGFYILARSKLLDFSINYDYIKDILRYSGPLVLHSLGFTIVAATDRFFLNHLVGLSSTGLYSVGYAVSSILNFFVGAFSMAWIPVLFEKLKKATDGIKLRLVGFTYLYFIVVAAMAVLLIIGAPLFLRVFVGKDFYGALQFVRWLALGFAAHGMYVVVAGYIFYHKKTNILAKIAGLIVVLNIILNYFLIKLNGAIGAAQATSLTFFIRFILVWYFSNKVYPMPWFSLRKIRSSLI